jgi:hypothetical protein
MPTPNNPPEDKWHIAGWSGGTRQRLTLQGLTAIGE